MATNFAVPVNNFTTTVTAPRSLGGGTISLTSTAGLPTLSAGQWFRMSFFRSQVPLTILQVTAVVGNNVTTTGPVDGLADAALQIGDTVEICNAAGTFSDIHTAVNALEIAPPGDLSTGTVLATGSTTARTLASRFTNTVYNVLDWGVKGDGVTDDQPAIMALLRYVSNLATGSSSRRVIYFPAGNYLIGSATNSQGVMVGKRFHLKADNTANPAGTPWPGISLIGDGYSTQLVSNCPTGLTEILRIEDCVISNVQGFRFFVSPTHPVTTAAFHITAISSGEYHRTEDVTVEVQPAVYAVTLTNGSSSVAGSGTNWTSALVGKALVFASDPAKALYTIAAVGSTTSLTLTSTFSGTSGATTAFIDGEGCPVGIGVSLDFINDSAQIHFFNCKVTGANFSGWMFGGGAPGNVLDIRCWGCQSVNNAIGVFGWGAPIVWYAGITSFNYITDFYMDGAADGPTLIEGIRSEGSNKLYMNLGGGNSRSPTTLANSTIAAWNGFTYLVTTNGVPPFFTMAVSVTNGSASVIGTRTFWLSHGQVLAGQTIVFQNDVTGHIYTVLSVASDTSLTLTTTYAGPTNSATFANIACPSFAINTDAGLPGTTVVTVTNGSAIVTGPSGWTSQLVGGANPKYLFFANDINQLPYSILSVDSPTQVTLATDRKGDTTYNGPSGLTTVTCGQVEAYAVVNRTGGVFHMEGLTFTHNPSPYFYARFNHSASTLYVTAVNVNSGAGTDLAGNTRSTVWNGGDHHVPNGMRYTVLPGVSNVSNDNNWQSSLGFLCDDQAHFSDTLSLNIYDGMTDQLQLRGGGIRSQKLADPTDVATITHGGTPGTTTYFYWYIATDLMGHRTLVSPVASTTTGPATINATNYNIIRIPNTSGVPNVAGVAFYDILRNTTNNVNTAGSVVTAWNPYTISPNFIFNDQVTAPSAYVLPTRNNTGDVWAGGRLRTDGGIALDVTYPGTGVGETNGVKTASTSTYGSNEAAMLQTVYDLARSMGLLA